MMTSDGATLAGLPSGVRQRIDVWTKSLHAALGDDLVGVLVHGSVARGEYRAGESDVDAVIVLKDPAFAKLEAIGNAMQLARYSARIEAMILREDEIAGASDAFPLLYDEIKRRNVLVFGRDPFASVHVHDTHRRLRVEQELREGQIRMRRAVTDALGAREAIGGAVARKVKQVRGALHALLGLKGVACAGDLPSVIAKVGEVYGVDVTLLADPRATRESPEAAYQALDLLLRKTISDVNAMDPMSVPPPAGAKAGSSP